MISNSWNVPKTYGASAAVLPSFTPPVRSSKPSTDEALGASDVVSFQNWNAPSQPVVPHAEQLSPEPKVDSGPRFEHGFSSSSLGDVSGVGQGAGPGTLTMGIEGPAYPTSATTSSQYHLMKFMNLSMAASSGRAISEQELEGLTDRQKVDIQQIQVSAMASQMGRIWEASHNLSAQLARP